MATDGWFPYAIKDPGKNANYRSGRTSNQMDVAHFTVGTDSRALIRNQGLAAFLFPKVGPPIQFAQADSVCAHACEFNQKGCGYEVERLNWNEGFTPDQTKWVGEVLRWRNREYGVPLVHYGGARLPTNTTFRGIANHGSLVHVKCDQHTDGWTDAEFQAAIGSTPRPASPEDTSMKVVVNKDTKDAVLVKDEGIVASLGKQGAFGTYSNPIGNTYALIYGFVELSQADFERLPQAQPEGARLAKWFAKLFPAKAERAGSY